jgi:hypothetical protein
MVTVVSTMAWCQPYSLQQALLPGIEGEVEQDAESSVCRTSLPQDAQLVVTTKR